MATILTKRFQSYEEAQKEYPLPLKVPRHIPSGFVLRGIQQDYLDIPQPPVSPSRIRSIYVAQGSQSEEPNHITIDQGVGGMPGLMTSIVRIPSHARGTQTLADGVVASWFRGRWEFERTADKDNPVSLVWRDNIPSIVLTWQHEGLTSAGVRTQSIIWLQTNCLTLEDVVQVADSLE